jgi:allantoin racemase
VRIKLVAADAGARRDLASRASWIDVAQLRPGTSIDFVATRDGPAGRGSPYDHALAELATLDVAMGAQDEGFDAVCIDDPGDPAIDALRSRLAIPVCGAGASSLWLGRLLGLPVAYLAARDEVSEVERMLVDTDPRTAFVQPLVGDPTGVDAPSVEAGAAEAARRGAASLALVGDAGPFAREATRATGLPAFGATLAAVKLAEVLVGLRLGRSAIAYVPARAVQDELVRERMSGDPPADPIRLTKPLRSAPERHIRVIVPHSDMDAAAVARRADVIVDGLLHPATQVLYTGTRTSPNRADSPYATLLMDLFCFDEGLRAMATDPDAMTIDSTTDSGIPALRSRAPMLVLGTGLATWALAAAVASRFSIIAMEPEWAYFYRKGLRAARLSQALASVRTVGVATDPYNLFDGKEAVMFERLVRLGQEAIDEDGAEAVVVGSTTMHQAGDHLAASLPAPVLNPGRVALRTIEAVLEMGLVQSRVAAPAPTEPNDGIFT